jgi:protein-disulfide isomerase
MTQRRRFITAILFLAVVVALPGPAGLAETGTGDLGAVRQDVDALKADMETIKKQLGEIQKQLAQRQTPPAQVDRTTVTMSVGDGPVLGRDDAPITIVEFSDYQCPFCRKHFTGAFATLKATYIDTGRVRYYFRDFPLDRVHPYARKAAESAHCAGDQGKFWDMHDVMFNNQETLKSDDFRDFAQSMQLDLDSFNACLSSGKYAKSVQADLAAGTAAGVTGTPGFFIGRTKKDGTIAATALKGALPASAFSQVIDRLLEEKEK